MAFDDGNEQLETPINSKESKEKIVSEHVSKLTKQHEATIQTLKNEIESLKQAKKEQEAENQKSSDDAKRVLLDAVKSIEETIERKNGEVQRLEYRIKTINKQIDDTKESHSKKLADISGKQGDLEARKTLLYAKFVALDEGEKELKSDLIQLSNKQEDCRARSQNNKEKEEQLEKDRKVFDEEVESVRASFKSTGEDLKNSASILDNNIQKFEDKESAAIKILEQAKAIETRDSESKKREEESVNDRRRLKELFKQIQEDTNKIVIKQKNQKAIDADLNRRKREVEILEKRVLNKQEE